MLERYDGHQGREQLRYSLRGHLRQERTCHRLIFRRICAENSVLKRRNTLTNLEKLLAEAKYAIIGKS